MESKLRVYTILEKWYAMDGFEWKEYPHVFIDRDTATHWVHSFTDSMIKKGWEARPDGDNENYWKVVKLLDHGELKITLSGQWQKVIDRPIKVTEERK